jgi:hypothetical protein
MNTQRIFSYLLLLVGEALIIICFLYFGSNLDTNILALNIIVSSIIYSLLFIDILFPIVDLKDNSQRTIGSIGLRWFFTFFYILSAIGVMVVFNIIKPIDTNSQIIIQCILVFLLLFGMYFSITSSHKVPEVFMEEKLNRSRLEEMKKATTDVLLKLDRIKAKPQDLISRLTTLKENLRFISPSNNHDAYELEKTFIAEMKTVQDCLLEIPINYDKIIENIQNCERTYNERKQIFSN